LHLLLRLLGLLGRLLSRLLSRLVAYPIAYLRLVGLNLVALNLVRLNLPRLLEDLEPLRPCLLPAVRLGLVALGLFCLFCLRLDCLLGRLCFIALRYLSIRLYFIAALRLRLDCPSLAQLRLYCLPYDLLGLAQPYLWLSYLHLLPCLRQL
jgi:hypothetical protein